MNLAQDNFERALVSGQTTIKTLRSETPILGHESTPRLRVMMWDLESIQAAIRLELMDRETQHPVDLG